MNQTSKMTSDRARAVSLTEMKARSESTPGLLGLLRTTQHNESKVDFVLNRLEELSLRLYGNHQTTGKMAGDGNDEDRPDPGVLIRVARAARNTGDTLDAIDAKLDEIFSALELSAGSKESLSERDPL